MSTIKTNIVGKKILITGSAGFIGFHVVLALLKQGYCVVGLDNLNDYYDTSLKKYRLKNIKEYVALERCPERYSFYEKDLSDYDAVSKIFNDEQFDIVINLAAQAGVRYSITNPTSYVSSNLTGFFNILECCRHNKIEHLLYASSSSVYGINSETPFKETHGTDHPISLYAATKKSNEILAHSYSHLYGLACTGLRFFTVYGPYGRPDMAYFKFVKAIINGDPIDVFNQGNLSRDFTYIDDVVTAISKLVIKPPVVEDASTSCYKAPYKIFNVGNNNPVSLMNFIESIEKSLGILAIKNFVEMQDGDVPTTFAAIESLNGYIGYQPETSIDLGIEKFVKWFNVYTDYLINVSDKKENG